jgi:cytoskeleton protein RodZ
LPALALPAAAPALPPSAAPTAPPPPSQTEERRASAVAESAARIVIRATADSWVQIRDATQSVLLTRVLKGGESYRVPDRAGVSMRTGNAGGLEITVDGTPVPSIGRLGAIRRNVALDPQALIAGTAVRE